MILVVAAVAEELRFWDARPHVETLVTGVGPVESAVATARALAISPPTLVVCAGIAGGFRGAAAVGDAVAVAHDHLAELGLEDGSPMPPLPGGVTLQSAAQSSPRLLEALHGRFAVVDAVTVATITTSHARAEALARRHGAAVEAMEGFAVLRAAAVASIPAIELRGVSNLAGPRAEGGWDFAAGARALATILDAFLDAVAAA